jgi:hypothetical protein
MNINELNGIKVRETITRLDDKGISIAQNRTIDIVKTRSEIGLDGLTSYQRGGTKVICFPYQHVTVMEYQTLKLVV